MATHVYRATIFGTYLGQQTQSVFHWIVSSSGPFPSQRNAILALNNALQTYPANTSSVYFHYENACVDAWSFQQCSIVSLPWTAQPVPFKGNFITGATAPTTPLPGPGLPPQVAGVIRRQVDIARRYANGRTFMPAVDSVSVVNGVMATTSQQYIRYGLLLGRLLGSITGVWDVAQPPVVFTPTLVRRGLVDTDGGPVISGALMIGQVDPITRTQRRRELGVGV